MTTARISKVDCKPKGAELAYDAFGNISKSILPGATGIQFLPPTTRPRTVPDAAGGLPTCDAWQPDLRCAPPLRLTQKAAEQPRPRATTMTYDALGRRVSRRQAPRTKRSSTPDGGKLALMNGQTVIKVFVPLPGQATAVYASTGLSYYRHSDWLGSTRLASTPTRTVYKDGAYAPFGEPYAETGTTDRNFTGQNQDLAGDLYDFPYRGVTRPKAAGSRRAAGQAMVDRADPQRGTRTV
jgi:YD repeat-containing protein